MAWKKLGAADLAATTNTSIYTVGATTEAIVNVNICNRTASDITVRLAIAESGTPGDEDWIEYDYSLAANSVLERTGLHMDTTMVLVAYASAVGVSVVAHGNERSTV
jgi:hypothetical protein